MDHIICPYCECKVSVADVDDEGGVCPECGAIITSATLAGEDGDEETAGEDDDGRSLADNEDEDFGDGGKPRRRRKRT